MQHPTQTRYPFLHGLFSWLYRKLSPEAGDRLAAKLEERIAKADKKEREKLYKSIGKRPVNWRKVIADLTLVILVAVIWLYIFWPQLAKAETTQAPASPDYTQPEFGTAIRGWLLDNPQILLQMAERLDQQRKAAQATAIKDTLTTHHTALFADARDIRAGVDAGGLPVFAEFLDYNCGFCRQGHSAVSAFQETHPEQSLILKMLPILGPGSDIAARTVLAVNSLYGHKAALTLHDDFMSYDSQLNEAAIDGLLTELATEIQADTAAITAERHAQAITDQLADTAALASRLGIQGTPAFVFENHIARGLQSQAQLETILKATQQ